MRVISELLLISLISLRVSAYQNITKTLNINNYSGFNEILDKIFNECSNNYDTVILHDINNNEKNFNSLPNLYSSLSVVLYSSIRIDKSLNNWKSIYTFVLFIKTNKFLKQTLTYFRKTFYVTHSGRQHILSAFIINQLDNGCRMYEEILSTMWKFNFIAYFICKRQKKNYVIFTINPFTNHIPRYWKLIKSLNNTWTILSQNYDEETICHELYFDRSKFLNGYKVNIAIPVRFGSKYKVYEWKTIGSRDFVKNSPTMIPLAREITSGIVSALNISVAILFMPNLISSDYKSETLINIFKNSSIDLFTQSFASKKYYIGMYEYTTVMFYHQSGILSYFQGFKTPIEKISDFYGLWILLYTFFILTITFVVVLVITQKFHFAIFEIIRLLITAGLYTPIKTFPHRIFFSMVFIYFLIIHATFSGHLSEFLTKLEPRKQAETLHDLMDSRFKRIYASTAARYFMDELMKNKDVVSYSTIKGYCWKEILINTSIVCINSYDILYSQLNNEEKLYVSKKPFNYQYGFYMIRMNWHLSDRINHVILWIWQSGLREYWSDRSLKKLMYFKSVNEARLSVDFSPISLNELTFAFIILITGLLCATVRFIIELLK